MQITKYTLDKTHYSWGEPISGTVTIKMGSGETISASRGDYIYLNIWTIISVDGEPKRLSDGEALKWPQLIRIMMSDITISKGGTKTISFNAEFPDKGSMESQWEYLAETYGVAIDGKDRLQPYILLDVVAWLMTDNPVSITAEKEVKLSGGFLYSRLSPQISNFIITDKHPGNPFGTFNGFILGGQSKPVFTAAATLDPLDPNLTATQKIQLVKTGANFENIVLAESEGTLGSELMLTLPLETGNISGWELCRCELSVTDSAGTTGSASQSVHLYDYAGPPQLSIPYGYELAERFTTITADDGAIDYAAADDGLNIWLSFGRKISRIATDEINIENPNLGQNQWYLDISYGENGGEMTTVVNALTGTDEVLTYEYIRDMELLSGVLFAPSKKYIIVLTLRDKVGNSASLTAYIDTAGGYFNVEKHGVAVGMRSTGTPENPIFECNYPAYFYAGIMLGGGSGDYPASGTEQNTGVKWVDGKPIYRAALVGSVAASGRIQLPQITPCTTIDTIIGISGTAVTPGGSNFMSLPHVSYAGLAYCVGVRAYKSGGGELYIGSQYSSGVDYVIIIEYTKTTDESGTSLLLDSDSNQLTDASGTALAAAATDEVYKLSYTGAQIDQSIARTSEMYTAFSNGSLKGEAGVGITSVTIMEVV